MASASHPKARLATAVRGFTLIEVMIVMAIIGILAAVAVPSYQDYLRRGKLPEAFSTLSTYRVKMEQYYQDNKSYGTGDCASGAAWTISKADAGTQTFDFSCELVGSGYLITATGSPSGTSHVYTIDNAGKKKTTTFKGGAVDKACWLVKGTEC